MPKVSKEGASQTEKMEGFEGHYEDLGGYTVGFETYTADADPAPLFQGLPNDRCQARHWGIVLKGKLVYKYAMAAKTLLLRAKHTMQNPGTRLSLLLGRRL